ncbi:hypothetical protein H0A36_28550, partial [Endozoicomonas sp. SM1973]
EQANYGRKTYEYDPVGNRTKRTTEKAGKTETQKLTYAENSNRLIKHEESNVSYDGMGNTQNNGNGLQLQYNGQGRLKAVVKGGATQAEYRYNAIGERIVKELGSQTVIYSYDQNGQLLEEAYYNASNQLFYTRNYAWLGTQPIAMLEQWLNDKGQSTKQQVAYIHSDHLNTPRVATNAAGQAVWQWQSDAFGVGLANEDVDGDGQKTVVALRFPGQVYDPESGLHYNYFRDYAPNLGRYIQSDPIGLEGGLNTYAYVLGNPLKLIDPMGLYSTVQKCTYPYNWAHCSAAGGNEAATANAARAAARAAAKEKVCEEDEGCPPCNPPAGELYNKVTHYKSHSKSGDITKGSHGCEEHTGSPVHWHYDTMRQNTKTCQCFEAKHQFGGCGVAPP